MKLYASKKNNLFGTDCAKTLFLWMTSFISIFCCLILFLRNHDVILAPNRIVIALGDTLMILSPFWIVKPGWRKTILIPVWGFCIYFLCSSIYFRFFYDVMPLSAFLWWGNVDSTVLGTIPTLLRPMDLVFVGFPLIVTFVFIYTKNSVIRYKIPTSLAITSLAAALLVYGAGQLRMIKNEYTWAVKLNWLGRIYLKPSCSAQVDLIYIGHLNYQLKYLFNKINNLMTSGKLDDSDRKMITDYLDEDNGDIYFIEGNERKNVVFIIVESLNSWVIGKKYTPDSISFTPVLDSLISDSATISALKVIPQIGIGQSSDGQLMYNTGLLPLRNDVAVSIYEENRFIGLSEVLDRRNSFEVIYESPKMWNHESTNKSYGYNYLYAQSDINQFAKEHYENRSPGKDEIIFNLALDHIEKSPKPFFCEITTISMHTPFVDDGATYDSRIDYVNDIGDKHRAYLKVSNYFDTELGKFINKLREMGLYDNTLIFIASDHNIPIGEGNVPNSRSDIAFLALNTGIGFKADYKVGQIDIYPTILDLCGVNETPHGWRGLGRSILDDNLRSAVSPDGVVHGVGDSTSVERQKKAWDINKLIIKSNYFKHCEQQ